MPLVVSIAVPLPTELLATLMDENVRGRDIMDVSVTVPSSLEETYASVEIEVNTDTNVGFDGLEVNTDVVVTLLEAVVSGLEVSDEGLPVKAGIPAKVVDGL